MNQQLQKKNFKPRYLF